MRTWIRRSTPCELRVERVGARSAQRSCFARSGQAWHGWARAARLQLGGLPLDLRIGARAAPARGRFTCRDTRLDGDVAPVPRAPRAPRPRQDDPGEHGRRIVEVLARDSRKNDRSSESTVGLAVAGRQDHGEAAPPRPRARGSPRPGRRPATAVADRVRRAAARGRAGPPRGAAAPRSSRPQYSSKSPRWQREVRRGSPRAPRGRARAPAPARRRRGRPGTARTTSSAAGAPARGV